METLMWILAGLIAFPFAYMLQFSAATLLIGRELTPSDSYRGLQDAITPPWQTNLTMLVWATCAAIVGGMWWNLGILSAVGGMALIIFGAVVARQVLPKPTGNHYRGLILRSMISRYADYTRDGDKLRADAIKQLLVLAGVDPGHNSSG